MSDQVVWREKHFFFSEVKNFEQKLTHIKRNEASIS